MRKRRRGGGKGSKGKHRTRLMKRVLRGGKR
jgi:hypothetical protein